MRKRAFEDYDWPEVMAALQALREKTEDEEPYAVNFLDAIEIVIDGMPPEAYK